MQSWSGEGEEELEGFFSAFELHHNSIDILHVLLNGVSAVRLSLYVYWYSMTSG